MALTNEEYLSAIYPKPANAKPKPAAATFNPAGVAATQNALRAMMGAPPPVSATPGSAAPGSAPQGGYAAPPRPNVSAAKRMPQVEMTATPAPFAVSTIDQVPQARAQPAARQGMGGVASDPYAPPAQQVDPTSQAAMLYRKNQLERALYHTLHGTDGQPINKPAVWDLQRQIGEVSPLLRGPAQPRDLVALRADREQADQRTINVAQSGLKAIPPDATDPRAMSERERLQTMLASMVGPPALPKDAEGRDMPTPEEAKRLAESAASANQTNQMRGLAQSQFDSRLAMENYQREQARRAMGTQARMEDVTARAGIAEQEARGANARAAGQVAEFSTSPEVLKQRLDIEKARGQAEVSRSQSEAQLADAKRRATEQGLTPEAQAITDEQSAVAIRKAGVNPESLGRAFEQVGTLAKGWVSTGGPIEQFVNGPAGTVNSVTGAFNSEAASAAISAAQREVDALERAAKLSPDSVVNIASDLLKMLPLPSADGEYKMEQPMFSLGGAALNTLAVNKATAVANGLNDLRGRLLKLSGRARQ